jgi:hypothetical protein
MKHLTPEEILVPEGCQVKLHTDLGRAYLHWEALCPVLTHAVIFADARCPDAVHRLRELTYLKELPRLTFLHLQCNALGTDSYPYFPDARRVGASLEHLFLECSRMHLLLDEGLRLRTLALYARKSLKLTMGEMETLEAFHVTCKGKDLVRTADALLLNPFRRRGELDWGQYIPIHKLQHGTCSMSYPPERARTPAQLLSSHCCGACPACLQEAGILHDPPCAPVKCKPCFQSVMSANMSAALQASSSQITPWDLCYELDDSRCARALHCAVLVMIIRTRLGDALHGVMWLFGLCTSRVHHAVTSRLACQQHMSSMPVGGRLCLGVCRAGYTSCVCCVMTLKNCPQTTAFCVKA